MTDDLKERVGRIENRIDANEKDSSESRRRLHEKIDTHSAAMNEKIEIMKDDITVLKVKSNIASVGIVSALGVFVAWLKGLFNT